MEPKTELQKNAIIDVRKKELETYQRAFDIQWLNNRMEDGRMGRCLALIQKETEMEKDFQERTDHTSIVNAKAQKETALGIEIAKNTREEANELLRRHYLRERDPQLRELIRKLQAGYVRRDLQQQILHNEYKRLQEKAEEANANRILNHALYDDKESKDKEDRNKMERSRQYSLELQQQLVNRQQQKHCEYEDTLIEKKMLDDIVRTMADEDQRELKHKQKQTEEMRQEMVTFQKARDAWKEKQKQMVIMEERKIEEQMKAASDRSLAIVQERERRLRLKEEANQKIAIKILADKAAKEERENIIKQLQEQEYIEKNIQEDESERRDKSRRARESRSVLMARVETSRREADQQSGRENRFREQVEEKLAAQAEKEKEKENSKREQARKYSEELKQQIRENERRRRDEREREERRAADVRAAQAAWDAEVSAESLLIVGEHAGHLRGYLQPGALPPGALSPAPAGGGLPSQPGAPSATSSAVHSESRLWDILWNLVIK